MGDRALDGYDRATFTHDGVTHELLRCGSGPAVIVIAEMPGITPKVLEFADRVVALGCTAVLPVLFGTPGRDPTPDAHGHLGAARYFLSSMVPACVSREFTVWASGKSSPVVTWLRALAVSEHERCGGPGVGAVGMCFTGGYALAMAADDVILAPVLSQPSMPIPLTPAQRGSIDISDEDLRIVKHRCAHDGLTACSSRTRSSPSTSSTNPVSRRARRSISCSTCSASGCWGLLVRASRHTHRRGIRGPEWGPGWARS
jgi:hypothetical protein